MGRIVAFWNLGRIVAWDELSPNRFRKRKQSLTRRERLKSAPYLRLKNRKVFKIVKMETLWAF